jgi:ribosomal 50S subunit-associated protein YjgA (DUF615 family)
MENLLTALEMRAEAIAEEIDAIQAFAEEVPDAYQARLRNILLRIRISPYIIGVDS